MPMPVPFAAAVPLSTMRKMSVLVAMVLVIMISCCGVVSATAPTCSGAVCNGVPNSQRSSADGQTYYCCPSSQVAPTTPQISNPSTWTCPSAQVCNPGAVAAFTGYGCAGTATYINSNAPINSATTSCVQVPALSEYIQLACGTTGNPWQLSEQSACSGTITYLSGPTYGLGNGACYNLNTGNSIGIDCTDSAPALIGSTVTNPAMHTELYVVPSSGQQSSSGINSVVAFWTDSNCQAGTASVLSSSSSTCLLATPNGGSAFYQATCASNSASAAWTVKVWNTGTYSQQSSACNNNAAPTNTYTGTGVTCMQVSIGSVVVDCTAASVGDEMNYVPSVDGPTWI